MLRGLTFKSLVTISLVILMLGGWVINLIHIRQEFYKPPSTELYLMYLGAVIPPYGAYLGFTK